MEKVQGEAKAALAKAQKEMKQYVDRHRGKAVMYKYHKLHLNLFPQILGLFQ